METPVPAPTSNKFDLHKVFAAIGIILIVLIIIGGAIWFFVQRAEDKAVNSSEQSETIASPSAKPKTASSSADTSDWKTYTNNTVGFTIKYPKDWLYNDSSTSANCSNKQDFFSPNKDELGVCASGFSGLINIGQTEVGDDLNKEVGLYNANDYTNFQKTDTTLAGKKAVKITGVSQINNEALDARGTKIIYYIVDLSNTSLFLNYNQTKTWLDESATFEQMVQTLTFK